MKNILEWKNDFFQELNSIDEKKNIENNSEDNKCLITNTELTTNYIELPCSHKFNYMPLYKEVLNQKKRNNRTLDVVHLRIHQMKCPYCRTIFDNLLPYIQMDGVEKCRGVNAPIKYSMFLSKCKYVFKSGKNKGNACNKDCNFGYCNQHQKIIDKQNNTKGCIHILKTGKNKGKQCMRKIKSNELCSVHLHI